MDILVIPLLLIGCLNKTVLCNYLNVILSYTGLIGGDTMYLCTGNVFCGIAEGCVWMEDLNDQR
jgi:hypothetical protein